MSEVYVSGYIICQGTAIVPKIYIIPSGVEVCNLDYSTLHK